MWAREGWGGEKERERDIQTGIAVFIFFRVANEGNYEDLSKAY